MSAAPGRAGIPSPIARLDPEQVAAALSVAVLVIAGIVLLSLTREAPATTVGESIPPIAGSTPATTPLASGDTPVESALPPAVLATLLARNEDILAARDDLTAAVTAEDPDAVGIARILRGLNPLLATAEGQVEATLSEASPTLARRLLDTYAAAHDASVETLRSSTTATEAYVAGGGEVLEALEPLAALAADLADLEPQIPPSG